MTLHHLTDHNPHIIPMGAIVIPKPLPNLKGRQLYLKRVLRPWWRVWLGV